MLWSFLADFQPLLGAHAPSLPTLLDALQLGSLSPALVHMHIGLLRFIQAEAEMAALGVSHAVRTRNLHLPSSLTVAWF